MKIARLAVEARGYPLIDISHAGKVKVSHEPSGIGVRSPQAQGETLPVHTGQEVGAGGRDGAASSVKFLSEAESESEGG